MNPKVPADILAMFVEAFSSLDVDFYASQIDDLSKTEPGLIDYLRPVRGIYRPYQYLFEFTLNDTPICFYKVPKSASTSVLEAFLALLEPQLTCLMSSTLVDEYRNLYYSFIHQMSKKYLAKDPVGAISRSTFCFAVHRPYRDRLASAVINKMIVIYLNNDEYEPFILSALHVTNSLAASNILGEMTLSEALDLARDLDDDHFRQSGESTLDGFRLYSINSLDTLASDLYDLTGAQLTFEKINVSTSSRLTQHPSLVSEKCSFPESPLQLSTQLKTLPRSSIDVVRRLLESHV